MFIDSRSSPGYRLRGHGRQGLALLEGVEVLGLRVFLAVVECSLCWEGIGMRSSFCLGLWSSLVSSEERSVQVGRFAPASEVDVLLHRGGERSRTLLQPLVRGGCVRPRHSSSCPYSSGGQRLRCGILLHGFCFFGSHSCNTQITISHTPCYLCVGTPFLLLDSLSLWFLCLVSLTLFVWCFLLFGCASLCHAMDFATFCTN